MMRATVGTTECIRIHMRKLAPTTSTRPCISTIYLCRSLRACACSVAPAAECLPTSCSVRLCIKELEDTDVAIPLEWKPAESWVVSAVQVAAKLFLIHEVYCHANMTTLHALLLLAFSCMLLLQSVIAQNLDTAHDIPCLDVTGTNPCVFQQYLFNVRPTLRRDPSVRQQPVIFRSVSPWRYSFFGVCSGEPFQMRRKWVNRYCTMACMCSYMHEITCCKSAQIFRFSTRSIKKILWAYGRNEHIHDACMSHWLVKG